MLRYDQRRDLKNCCVVCRDYILISNFTVMTLIPFLLLSVFNYLLFKTIRHSGRINQKTSLRQKRDQKIAAILILLVTVFASCNCVRIVTNVYEVTTVISVIVERCREKLCLGYRFEIAILITVIYVIRCRPVLSLKFKKINNCSTHIKLQTCYFNF